MKLSVDQYEALTQPLAASRVAKRSQAGMSLSYLEAWDVKAHLIRIFGFGGWSADVLSADLVFEEKTEKGRWEVAYKVVMRLRIHSEEESGATYTEAAVGSATLPQRGEAHDMAVKTAESDALKRAAINLGTQFGLSLYDNGSRKDVVRETLKAPEGYAPAPPVEVTEELLGSVLDEVLEAVSTRTLQNVWESASVGGYLDAEVGDGETVRSIILERVAFIKGGEE